MGVFHNAPIHLPRLTDRRDCVRRPVSKADLGLVSALCLGAGLFDALKNFILRNFHGIVDKAYAAYDAHGVQHLMCAAHCDFIGLSLELKL